MIGKLTLCLLLAGSSLLAAHRDQIAHLLHLILSTQPDQPLPKTEDLGALMDVNDVTAAGIETLLPKARQCLTSSRQEVRGYGLLFATSVMLRPDSSKLLEPYLDDLGSIANDLASSFRRGVFFILGNARPRPSQKAVSILAAHLEDKANSALDELTIAASLLKASPKDLETFHGVLSVVETKSDAVITDGIIRTLGLMKTRNQEALSFIARNLDSGNPCIRAAAVDATSRLDRDLRLTLAPQLRRIAADGNEPEHVRSQAEDALRD